ncbi:NAD(+) diphosphatase [Pseudoxanthobacter sp.]|uniref:NAD(+) diphosphatase n=1 Tax=Pseudoxanthobacter sp. TaxID=1925742 RepID=UPI002FE037DF
MAPIDFPPVDLSRLTGYGRTRTDRTAERRHDAAWIEALWQQPETGVVLVAADHVAVAGDPPVIVRPAALARSLGRTLEEAVFLGLEDGQGRFAVPFTLEEAAQLGEATADTRSLASEGRLAPDEQGLLAQARSLVYWHQSHRFCSVCGNATRLTEGGYRRDCPACGAHHFPRTDPVAIMLVVDDERCVLGRQARFAPGMYSCLAGFIEPGETIEDAVRREVREESHIRVGRVRYLASQPWPFPASLMIGCLGEALTRDIRRDDAELEDCRWFSRDEVRAMLEGTHPEGLTGPKPFAIAHHLMAAWVAGG